MSTANVFSALPVTIILFVIIAMLLMLLVALVRGANRGAHWLDDKAHHRDTHGMHHGH